MIICIFLYTRIIAEKKKYDTDNKINNEKHSMYNTLINDEPKKILTENNNVLLLNQPNRFKLTDTPQQKPSSVTQKNTDHSDTTTQKKHALKNNVKQKNITTDNIGQKNTRNNSNELDNLLNTFINDIKIPAKNNAINNDEINAYKKIISKSIQNKFYNASSYSGKQCTIRIKFAPDGAILSVSSISGDPELCQAAIIAVKSAKIPQPLNINIYKAFENTILNFAPQ
ncbi:cell envelope integrity protein TolA [Candidatus Blochmannia ocreatus (nom. nud.)]|uniref:Cell envelope integrity protein TolA n=1 Tax=Candidatus Blochmannia ocreatus (nom. nud.) TaxID=251538 RepID=A0ABY4STU7_9ENTR|nr:cell envelope integrity protein TolA [Candidatus Blochmannia ocreatus]URJ25397.1 cell envelope integrity protein TolA [Candidatus Blochmannia ocreatus]